MDIQEQLREEMRRERANERNNRRELRQRDAEAPLAYIDQEFGRNGHPGVEQDRPRRQRGTLPSEELEDTGNPPALDAALRSLLRNYGMDFLNFKSKGHFEGFGPYFVDNNIQFDSARRYNPDSTATILNGELSFQVGDFINDLNTTSALFNLVQMELTPLYIPLCGNEKILRWGVVQLFIVQFLSESASRNRQQIGSWHWELTAEVVGPRIRLSPNPQQRLFTFRIPIKRVDDVLTFRFQTPSGPIVFCNEFAPGNRVSFDGVDTFETFQNTSAVNTGFNVGEFVALEKRRMPSGPQSPTGQWIPGQIIQGTDLQGMEVLALPSASEIAVDPGDVDTSILQAGSNSDWRLHNLSRQVLITIRFRSVRSEPTQYLIATAR